MAVFNTIKDLTEKAQQKKSGISSQVAAGTAQKAPSSSVTGNQNTGSAVQGSTQQGATQSGSGQQMDSVAQAQALLQQQMQNKPGAYQSQYQSQLEALTGQILGRDPFSYDVNADALYQQMVKQYADQGRMAMEDTMGQAQAMTGGYANSYAQQAGQQAYQGYLRQAAEMLPEYYQMARDQYNQEGQELYNRYGLLLGQDDTAYGRYMDAVNSYYAELDRLQGVYDQERAFQYQQGRDTIADQQWQAEFDESVRQFNKRHGIKSTSRSDSSSVVSPDSMSGNSGYDTHGYTKEQIMAMQEAAGITADGIWGPNTQMVYDAGYRPESQTGSNPNGGTEFNGKSYSEAAAYLKANGASASGLMTQSEWQRHKNNNSSADGEHEASNYQEYLAAYVLGKTER